MYVPVQYPWIWLVEGDSTSRALNIHFQSWARLPVFESKASTENRSKHITGNHGTHGTRSSTIDRYDCCFWPGSYPYIHLLDIIRAQQDDSILWERLSAFVSWPKLTKDPKICLVTTVFVASFWARHIGPLTTSVQCYPKSWLIHVRRQHVLEKVTSFVGWARMSLFVPYRHRPTNTNCPLSYFKIKTWGAGFWGP